MMGLVNLVLAIPFVLWYAIAAGYAGYSYWQWSENEKVPAEQVVEQKTLELASLKRRESTIKDFERQKEQRLKELAELASKLETTVNSLPRTSSIPDLLKTFADLSDKTGLDFPSFKPGPTTDWEEPFIKKTALEISLKGTYVQIMSFLDSLANMTRIVSTQKLSLTSPQLRDNVSILNAKVDVLTYNLAQDFRADTSVRPNAAATNNKPKGGG